MAFGKEFRSLDSISPILRLFSVKYSTVLDLNVFLITNKFLNGFHVSLPTDNVYYTHMLLTSALEKLP